MLRVSVSNLDRAAVGTFVDRLTEAGRVLGSQDSRALGRSG